MDSGNNTRFEALYRAHAREVYAYCLRRSNADEAKDAMSEVFVVAWRRREELADGDDVLPWLYGVSRKVLANRSRSYRRRQRWQSSNGTTWTEATGLTSGHRFDGSRLVEWQGELVEHVAAGPITSLSDDTTVWTLEGQQVFVDIPTRGMLLDISGFGLIGTPGYGWSGPDATQILFSADGTKWSRWEPTEFSIGGSHESPGDHMGEARIVGVGDDFVVIHHLPWDAESRLPTTFWVGTIE